MEAIYSIVVCYIVCYRTTKIFEAGCHQDIIYIIIIIIYIYIYVYIYVYIPPLRPVVTQPRLPRAPCLCWRRRRRRRAPNWPLQDIVLLRGFCARINHPFIATFHLHCPHYCNTIAPLLRNIRRPPDPLVYAIHHTILVMAISCKGQTPNAPASGSSAWPSQYICWFIRGLCTSQYYSWHSTPPSLQPPRRM